MGYETKLYIVQKTSLSAREVICVNNKVYEVYDGKHYFLEDGNTQIKVKNPATHKSVCCHAIAMIEMSKMGLSLGSICKFHESNTHCFDPSNGNGYLGLDPYNEYRKFVPIDNAIKIMTEAHKDNPYRRFAMALALMESVKKGFQLDEIGILEYGH